MKKPSQDELNEVSKEIEEYYIGQGKTKALDIFLRLMRLKCKCRISGLKIDILNHYKYEGRLDEYEELNNHLEDIKWIIADIECAHKYLDYIEKSEFEELKKEILNQTNDKEEE